MASKSDNSAIVARDVSKRFLLRHNPAMSVKDRVLGIFEARRRERVEPFWALRDVSLTVDRGEALALIGRNGSGKSTLLKLIAGIIVPDSGHVFVRKGARVGTMIELGVGFHPELTALENVYLNAAIHGQARDEIDALVPRVVEYSGLANFMDVPLRNFSSGMHMRLAFAVAANLVPDLLLIDEVFAVGDIDFQQRCVATMQSFRERGCTILFVSHSTGAVADVCTRAAVLEAGALSFDGAVDEGLAHYQQQVAKDATSILPGAANRPGPLTDPETWPHRLAIGQWSELGPWAREFLKEAGMTRQSFVLDVGCGSLPVGVAILPELDQSRYWGYEFDRQLLERGMVVELRNRGLQAERGHFILNSHCDLSLSPHLFDLALAHSLAVRITAAQLGVAVAAVVGHLAPGGKFFLSLPKDRHDQLDVAQSVCATIHAHMEPTNESRHPRGESVWLISRG